MSSRYPSCAKCGKALGVKVGLKRGDLIFCNRDCEAQHYEFPQDEATQDSAVLYGALDALRQQNPRLSEASLLALHYLGWTELPEKGTEDHKTFHKVRGWVKDSPKT